MPRFRTTRSIPAARAGREGAPHFLPSAALGERPRVAASPELRLPTGLRWKLAADWAAICGTSQSPGQTTDAQALRIWLAEAEASVVKHGPHRTVYRLCREGTAVYLKHYRTARWIDGAKHFFRSTAARREWRSLLELARRGVPAPRAIAIGERAIGPIVFDSLLITAELPNTCSLEEFATEELWRLPDNSGRRAARRLLETTARFCARVHLAGVEHRDFHDGNLLVDKTALHQRLRTERAKGASVADENQELLYLLDVPGLGLSAPLDWTRSCNNLAMLAGEWRESLSRIDGCRFLRTYLAARPDLRGVSFRQAAAAFDARTREHARHTIRSRDKRSLRDNRDFRRVDAQGMVGHAVRGLDGGELLRLMSLAEHASKQQRSAAARRPLVVETTLVEGREITVEIGCLGQRRSFWPNARSARRAALATWIVGHSLRQRGIAAPLPLFACWPRRVFSPRGAIVATERVVATPMAQAIASSGRRRACLVAAGRLVGRMHSWSVGVDGWSLDRLAISGDSVEPFAQLAHLAGVRLSSADSFSRRSTELGQLLRAACAATTLSKTDCLRFLLAYCDALDEPHTAWKRLWTAVDAPR